jgi:uncharacterized protein involved in copper resistance
VIKQRINAALLFLLITAFLAVQWAPAHVHLTGQHEHSGERHRHSAEAHAHQAAAIHADAIDFAHSQLDEAQVVSLDHDALTPSSCQLDKAAVPLATDVRCPPRVEVLAVDLPADRNELPDRLPAHVGQARAPPPLA